ncbi:unnamed protein product, partial [marine sediment metagenome]
MAELSGENGDVYFNEGLTNPALANTIIFGPGSTGILTDQTITSSTAGGTSGKINFEDAGYVEGMLVKVEDATSSGNNRIFTINAVNNFELTVNEAVTTGSDTGTPVFTEWEPGIQVLGFYNWTSSLVGDTLETTDFDSSGYREYIAGLTGWTATA